MPYDPIHPEPTPTPSNEYGYTDNFKLILNKENTITSWLQIFNTNMKKIDDIMHSLELRTSIDGEVPPEAIEDILKLQELVQGLQADLKAVDDELHLVITQVAELQSLRPEVDVLKQNYINLDKSSTAHSLTITALQQSVQKLEVAVEPIPDIQSQIEALTARVTELEGKVT